MKLSTKVKKLYTQVNTADIRMGEIKKIAKQVKTDHAIAMELWGTGDYLPRMLAVLIMDKKELTQEVIDTLVADMQSHTEEERNYLSEWLMANQLMKSKPTLALLESWQNHTSPTLRRLFWYHQARLRWTGQTPPDNTAPLVAALKKEFASEEPEVQWTMNMCAAWIGVYTPQYRKECVALGEKVGLYKDEKVVKHCTPNYLPEFIRVETTKLATK